MEGLIMTSQLLLSLSILIVVHEWGHFISARMFKIKVEKFYLFFDFLFPLANVLNFSLIKYKKGDTEYGVGWFPLGGYVKIAGMVDESMDKEQMNAPAQPWEFRSKPAWQTTHRYARRYYRQRLRWCYHLHLPHLHHGGNLSS
ncbi:MAG: site-2 protease family protein [Bacteroidota bacterium]